MSEQEYPLEHDRDGLTGGYGGGTGVGEPGIDPAAGPSGDGDEAADFALEPEREAQEDGAGGG